MLVIKKHSVYKDDLELFAVEKPILDFLEVNDNLIVLLEENYGVNNNVVCYNGDGKYLWRIENQQYIHETCPATAICLKDGALLVYHRCGIEAEIDVQTGKVINSKLIK